MRHQFFSKEKENAPPPTPNLSGAIHKTIWSLMITLSWLLVDY